MRVRRHMVVALGLAAALGLPGRGRGAPAAGPHMPAYRETPAIDVVSALYGPIGFAGDCNVVNKVRDLCAGKISCSVPIDRRLCPDPPTPLPGLIMRLTVSYKCTQKSAARQQSGEAPLALAVVCG